MKTITIPFHYLWSGLGDLTTTQHNGKRLGWRMMCLSNVSHTHLILRSHGLSKARASFAPTNKKKVVPSSTKWRIRRKKASYYLKYNQFGASPFGSPPPSIISNYYQNYNSIKGTLKGGSSTFILSSKEPSPKKEEKRCGTSREREAVVD
jgi:hypothetical protein